MALQKLNPKVLEALGQAKFGRMKQSSLITN
jgi:hypothetical protein